MSSNSKNLKLKKGPVAVTVIAVLAVVFLITGVVVALNKGKKTDNSASVNLSDTDLKAVNATASNKGQDASYEAQTETTTVEILLDNTAAAVGTEFKLGVIITPVDAEKALRWSSSNENVLTVDDSGIVKITGVGIASVTATVGSTSDAVIIEGISSVVNGSDYGYPVYVANTGSGSNGSSGAGASSSGSSTGAGNSSGSGNSSSSSASSGNSSGSGSSTGSGNSSGSGSSTGTGSSSSGSTGSSNSSGSDNNSDIGNSSNNSNSAGTSDSGNSGASTGSGSGSSDIEGTLVNNGFSQTVSNVYVCEENGTYYGEIITQPNVTIFYIKQRSASFDSRIQSVIGEMLPGYTSTVWNNYISANTDRTFTVDGRTVRIVAATGGGHSQIVIYN